MSKAKDSSANPPKNADLIAQLRWFLRHADELPVDIARATSIHHSALYRFLGSQRGLSDDAMDRLAKHLKLRLVRDVK